MTGTQDWGFVPAPDGGIMGVYSLAEGTPLKRDGFPEDFADFATAISYRDWRFTYLARGPAGETN